MCGWVAASAAGLGPHRRSGPCIQRPGPRAGPRCHSGVLVRLPARPLTRRAPHPTPPTRVVKLLQHVGIGRGAHNLFSLLDRARHALQLAWRQPSLLACGGQLPKNRRAGQAAAAAAAAGTRSLQPAAAPSCPPAQAHQLAAGQHQLCAKRLEQHTPVGQSRRQRRGDGGATTWAGSSPAALAQPHIMPSAAQRSAAGAAGPAHRSVDMVSGMVSTSL